MQKKLMVALVLATLPACAGPKITAEDVAIARYQSESQQACYRAQAAQAQQYPDARDAALVIMAQALAGRGNNPCGKSFCTLQVVVQRGVRNTYSLFL